MTKDANADSTGPVTSRDLTSQDLTSVKPVSLNLDALVDLQQINQILHNAGLVDEAPAIVEALNEVTTHSRHGDLARWLRALSELPELGCLPTNLNVDSVCVEQPETLPIDAKVQLEASLRKLIPWRKGPYSICGIDIDTEWRSDWKWHRLEPHISPLAGRKILDVGCGNGYHLWRMSGAGARLALGVDPVALFAVQFRALQHFICSSSAALLPMRLEQLPAKLGCFDTVFSMGVIYHHKLPTSHLEDLRGALVPDGELVLETLVMPPGHPTLVPEGRYARMRNIGQIPNSHTLHRWVQDAGFDDVRVVSESATSVQEQRSTDWMPFDSLADALEAEEMRTIEGHPAPRRAILIARRA